MKKLTYLLFIITSISFAQNSKKEIEFKVYGNCDMCKSRIEKSLEIKGVKFSNWNPETQMIKVVYDTNKVSETQIHKEISEVGHDTEKIKASDEKYNDLHGCCKYERNADLKNKEDE